MVKQKTAKKFTKKDIPLLKYGIIHSQFGYLDGVSIVMEQIEHVMTENIGIPKNQIYYLAGRSKHHGKNIVINRKLWVNEKTNRSMIDRFKLGYGVDLIEQIENAITNAKQIIHNFIAKHKIDVIIAHNTSHPVNFVLSVALHRYYRDALAAGEKTPKYILWWHDSHLEREIFQHAAPDVYQYLLHGVPGSFVEYIIFINNLQFKDAEKYFKDLDKLSPGFFDAIYKCHTIIYNTTDTFIDSYDDIESDLMKDRIEVFFDGFGIRELLKKSGVDLSETMFCLQHTRIVERKRIDFALKFCFELLNKKIKTGKHTRALYFLVSGHKADGTKNNLKKLHKKLSKEYKINTLFLIFAEDYDKKTNIKFEEYPIIFAKLRGFSTYFSETEGFGNNLLEVLASGLIPIVYTYPVFVNDIAKYKFKVIALDKFEINEKVINQTLEIIKNNRKRKAWVNKNLKILRRKFPHRLIAFKLKRAIIRKRLHE